MAERYSLFRWPQVALFASLVLLFLDVRFAFASPGQVAAADGISLGRSVHWEQIELGPGYRADLLVKGGSPRTYCLRSGALPKLSSFRSLRAALRLAESRNLDESPQELVARLPEFIADSPGDRIARVIVESDPVDMKLSSDGQLKPLVPQKLVPITDGGITTATEQLLFNMAFQTCTDDGHCPPRKCKQALPAVSSGFLLAQTEIKSSCLISGVPFG